MKEGALRVWWIPQVPGEPFHYPVTTPEEGARLCDCLAKYDLFQYENNIKPDYFNAGGLEVCEKDLDGKPEWTDWYNDDGEEVGDLIDRIENWGKE